MYRFIISFFIFIIILWDLNKLIFIYLFIYCFLGPHPWHMEGPRLGTELELQLLAYAIATAMQDLSHVCDLHQVIDLWPNQIPDLLSKAREQTFILMDTSQIRFPCTTMETLINSFTGSNNVLIYVIFTYAESCHLWLILPFQFGYFVFIILTFYPDKNF